MSVGGCAGIFDCTIAPAALGKSKRRPAFTNTEDVTAARAYSNATCGAHETTGVVLSSAGIAVLNSSSSTVNGRQRKMTNDMYYYHQLLMILNALQTKCSLCLALSASLLVCLLLVDVVVHLLAGCRCWLCTTLHRAFH